MGASDSWGNRMGIFFGDYMYYMFGPWSWEVIIRKIIIFKICVSPSV